MALARPISTLALCSLICQKKVYGLRIVHIIWARTKAIHWTRNRARARARARARSRARARARAMAQTVAKVRAY